MISFGPFQLFPYERRLLRDEQPLNVGSRSLEILIALVERAGEVVGKRALVERVWPDLVVEETSLRTHIAGLRRVLGDGRNGARYVVNVPGRGYCFASPIVHAHPEKTHRPAESLPARQAVRLPSKLDRMIGREDAVASLCTQILAQRFVSIVGPGGMGKTTVAIAVAHALAEEFRGSVIFVDLGSIGDPGRVTGTVATTLGLPVDASDPILNLLGFLDHKHCLIVLDSCEHVIESVAALAERIYVAASQVHILVTSREALRVEGERVHRLAPLGAPDPDGDSALTAAEALTFPAIQLFMERAAAGGSSITLSDADAPIVAGICRKLDGIALAVELAAGRVAVHGIRGTAELLESRFELIWQGRRTAVPRHQTLNATLDWSYNLLSEVERRVLRRLSVFVGPFTLRAAQTVVATDLEAEQIVEILGNLAAKSLVSTQSHGGFASYHLLDTTRSHVAAKLAQSNEADTMARRHAIYFLKLLADADAGAGSSPGSVSASSAHMGYLGNVRAALEWCFSPSGDADVGRDLIIAVAPLFLRCSMLSECHNWSTQALATLVEAEKGTERELALREAQAISAMFTLGNDGSVQEGIQRCLDLASALNAASRQPQLLAGLNIFSIRIGDFKGALRIAEKSEALLRTIPDPSFAVVADWQLGASHHFVGNQAEAQRYCERGFQREASLHKVNTQLCGYDQRIQALVGLARTLWLRGFLDRAAQVARQAIEEAARLGQPLSVCISLIYSTSVFLWKGDWDAAGIGIAKVIKEAQKYSLGPCHAVGLGMQGELTFRQGNHGGGIALLRRALDMLASKQHMLLTPQFGAALAEALAAAGQFDQALATIDGAIAQRSLSGASFDMPEMLRIKAQILMRCAQGSSAEQCLMQSLELARDQSALSWELRSATALVRARPTSSEARRLLGAVRDRFVEGFDTPDLLLARQLLGDTPQAA
jgi:predicted ATPase/DNA-binding winged helix-turn-helix (wHTH) protein